MHEYRYETQAFGINTYSLNAKQESAFHPRRKMERQYFQWELVHLHALNMNDRHGFRNCDISPY